MGAPEEEEKEEEEEEEEEEAEEKEEEDADDGVDRERTRGGRMALCMHVGIQEGKRDEREDKMRWDQMF